MRNLLILIFILGLVFTNGIPLTIGSTPKDSQQTSTNGEESFNLNREYTPTEYLYGRNDGVLSQVELSARLHEQGAQGLSAVVMIQCVGSRNDQNPNCSRICCQAAVKNAIHIKKLNPEAQVYILYRDIRTYGLLEDYYQEARKLGVIFFRYDTDAPPRVEARDGGLSVTFRDGIIGRDLQVDADLVALSAGMVPTDTEELASLVKLARTPEGHFMEAHVKLRPVDMATEGLFICGTAHRPQLLNESISQGGCVIHSFIDP